MITENDPMLPRKVDLDRNPTGTELKIAQHRELDMEVSSEVHWTKSADSCKWLSW